MLEAPLKGGKPVRSSIRRHPKDHISAWHVEKLALKAI